MKSARYKFAGDKKDRSRLDRSRAVEKNIKDERSGDTNENARDGV